MKHEYLRGKTYAVSKKLPTLCYGSYIDKEGTVDGG